MTCEERTMHDPVWLTAGYVALGAIFIGLIASMWFAMRSDKNFGH
jgi:hypothetical protein